MYYINYKYQNNPVETVDEFNTRKEAIEAVKEYNRALKGGCYISTRCINDWRNR